MSVSPNQIVISLERDALFDSIGLDTLQDRYMLPTETSPQHALARAAAAFADNVEHAQRLYDYASQQWFMFATPLLSNGGTERGLPISCFLNFVGDSRKSIFAHYTENGWLSSMGGGIGSFWGALRSTNEATSKGSASSGVIPFVKVVDSEMLAVSQGVTRRGSTAVYLDVSHPEIVEWLGMRRKSGGDINRKTLNLHNGVCIPDAFMRAVEKGTVWHLIDPHSKAVKGTIDARSLWRQILITRVETGEPYLFFVDTANRALPKALQDRGLRIHASNLCCEIMLPTNEERTAVCCLSSVNLAKWDEWSTNAFFILDLMRMLDNALQVYIDTAPPEHYRAIFSASRERSVGLGAMGFHTFLQSKLIPLESEAARAWNVMMFQHIREWADIASRVGAVARGEAPDMVGTGERFAHKMAVAPNASSSIICGNVSPSIEPMAANGYLQKTMGGTFIAKNACLIPHLEEVGLNTQSVWRSIASHKGSIQHLDGLSDKVKAVFRTAMEVDQMALIDLAADRQVYIDQAQSVNLFLAPDVPAKLLHQLHFSAWKKGLKSLYYVRSESVKKANTAGMTNDRVDLKVGDILSSTDDRYDGLVVTSVAVSECLACEG